MSNRNRTFLLTSLVLLVVFISSFIVSVAGELVIRGELVPPGYDDTDPRFHRPRSVGDGPGDYDDVGTCSSRSIYSDMVPYDLYSFAVTESGWYLFDLRPDSTATDAHLILYSSEVPFTGNGLDPCVAQVDDSYVGSCCPQLTVELEAGLWYTIMVTTFDDNEHGWYTLRISGPGDFVDGPFFTDGRINFMDAANPIVVYGNDDGGIDIWSDAGEFLITIDAGTLAFDVCPEENTVIATLDSPYTIVSKLSSCGIQINSAMPNGKTYVLYFPDLGGYYESWEIEP